MSKHSRDTFQKSNVQILYRRYKSNERLDVYRANMYIGLETRAVRVLGQHLSPLVTYS